MATPADLDRLVTLQPMQTPSKVERARYLDELAQQFSDYAVYDVDRDVMIISVDPVHLSQIVKILQYISSEIKP